MNQSEKIIMDIENTTKTVRALMSSPHYKKMGSEGVFAIVEKAKSIGISPMDALNGGLFYVQGKVEMTSATMNQLIRMQKHSITKDKKSDNTICILHGKRADNGDTWVESFSIEDAKQANIYRNQWLKYPKDMLFARALSRLARQLFPDVIKGCYVQGEISEAPTFDEPPEDPEDKSSTVVEINADSITIEEAENLHKLIGDDSAYRNCVISFLKKQFDCDSIEDMPRSIYEKILPVATEKFNKRQSEALEFVYGEEQQIAMEG